jgi:hypothetical protein
MIYYAIVKKYIIVVDFPLENLIFGNTLNTYLKFV